MKNDQSQYFLGIHYYFEGNYEEAWFYFKRAFEIGYPIHCEFYQQPIIIEFLPIISKFNSLNIFL